MPRLPNISERNRISIGTSDGNGVLPSDRHAIRSRPEWYKAAPRAARDNKPPVDHQVGFAGLPMWLDGGRVPIGSGTEANLGRCGLGLLVQLTIE